MIVPYNTTIRTVLLFCLLHLNYQDLFVSTNIYSDIRYDRCFCKAFTVSTTTTSTGALLSSISRQQQLRQQLRQQPQQQQHHHLIHTTTATTATTATKRFTKHDRTHTTTALSFCHQDDSKTTTGSSTKHRTTGRWSRQETPCCTFQYRSMPMTRNDDNANEENSLEIESDTTKTLLSISKEQQATVVPVSYFNVSDIVNRFTNPIIDDPGLPLSDVLIAQVIAPSLQVLWISLLHGPSPSWVQPLFDTSLLYTQRGSYIAPTLIHGAALASCWITGALAAKAYERKSISPIPIYESKQKEPQQQQQSLSTTTVMSSSKNTKKVIQWDYSNVIVAIVKSGAFAIGILVLATQMDIFFEYRRYVQYGESEEINFRLLLATIELINDIVFEAMTILIWRLFLAYQTERMFQQRDE